MVEMTAGSGDTIQIVGHGLVVEREIGLAEGISLSPETPPAFTSSFGSYGSQFQADAAMLAMEKIATFSLKVQHPSGGEELAAKAWNALWVFSLLSLACRSPAVSLYSIAEGTLRPTLANRNLVIRAAEQVIPMTDEQLNWASSNYQSFTALLSEERFIASQRYYNNAHYLPDFDARLMLLWAGIEGLLNVEGELRRRIALHAAILHDGDRGEKLHLLREVKKAYDIRSKIVHGAQTDTAKLSAAAVFASNLLVGLLRKVVQLSRVPAASELDEAAASVSFG